MSLDCIKKCFIVYYMEQKNKTCHFHFFRKNVFLISGRNPTKTFREKSSIFGPLKFF